MWNATCRQNKQPRAAVPTWFCRSSEKLSSVCCAGSQRFAVEGVSVVGLGPEVQVGGRKLFGLTKEEISAGFKVKVQALDQCATLGAREVRQHVHAEDAIEATDVHGLGQIHGVERDQAAQARLHQQVCALLG